MLSEEQIVEMIKKNITFYGFKIVTIDQRSAFMWDCTRITIEVPNEVLEHIGEKLT